MRSSRVVLLLGGLLLNLGACVADVPVTCPGEGDYEYADLLREAPGTVKAPSAINEPENAINGVVEGQEDAGSLDVFSRGLSTDPPNNYLVLEWSGRDVADGPGPDFVVFENAFATAGGVFMDPAVVEVSADGESWTAMPHDYLAPDETRYSRDPEDWSGFAGVTPSTWRSVTCTSPFAEGAGGDTFDLSDVGLTAFRFLRMTVAATLTNPDSGEPYPRDPIADGFDLDGVFARQTQPR